MQGLGGDVRFFTSRARPLRGLDEIRTPEHQVATANLGLARGIQSFLRAAGVKLPRDACSLARLTGPNHFGTAFRRDPRLRLLMVHGLGERERAIVERGGGVPLVFRSAAGGAPLGQALAAGPAAAPRTVAPVTSFGPLVAASRGATARLRQFQPMNVQVTERKARAGHDLLVLKVDRDFGAGLGTISFLFGSGIIVEPDFAALQVTGVGGRRFPLLGTHADGPQLELVYELPRDARELSLVDGEARWPLGPLLSAPQAAR